MIYGSSPLLGIKSTALTGPTGPTGLAGPVGNIGPMGPGFTGNTGPSIVGMSLNAQGLVSSRFNDNVSFLSVSTIKGETGNYYLPADASVLSTGFNIIKGVSYYYSDGESIQNVIKFRGFTTASSDVITFNLNAQNNINIDYSIANLAYLGISGGSTPQLVYNKPGDKQYGLTGTSYNIDTNSVIAQVANYSERIVIVNPIFEYTAAGTGFYYWNIDWELGNIFKLNPWANDPGAGALDVIAQLINIRSPSDETVSKGITIIIPNGVTSSNDYTTLYATTDDITATPDITNFEEGVSWPLTIPPCFTQYVDILNLISIGDIWHASFSHLGFTFGVPSATIGDVGKIPTQIQLQNVNFDCARGNTITGVCCPSTCGLTAFETIEALCDGIFYIGMTLGGTCDTLCAQTGVCCLKLNNGQIVQTPGFVQQCECATFASQQNAIDYIWTLKDYTITSVSDINCEEAFNGIGPCCDGRGTCRKVTQEVCAQDFHYFQGFGLQCTTPAGIQRCSGGTGGCCESPTEICTNGYTGLDCIANNNLYFGLGMNCADFSCTKSCYQPISGLPLLEVGTEFEGGIVVGIFNPKNAKCLGNTAFGGLPSNLQSEISTGLTSEAIFNYLTNGNEKIAELYNTKYNKAGYGFNRTPSHTCDEDSWLMIVSKYPVMLDETGATPTDIQSTKSVKKFTWSNGGLYYGNIMTEFGEIPANTEISANDPYYEDYTKDEGWYSYNFTEPTIFAKYEYSDIVGCGQISELITSCCCPSEISYTNDITARYPTLTIGKINVGTTYNTTVKLTSKLPSNNTRAVRIYYPSLKVSPNEEDELKRIRFYGRAMGPISAVNVIDPLDPLAIAINYIEGSSTEVNINYTPNATGTVTYGGVTRELDYHNIVWQMWKENATITGISCDTDITIKVDLRKTHHYGNVYTHNNCSNEYNTKPILRSGTIPFTSRTTMNGKWMTNWGLYNTIRMVCAERHAYNTDPGFPDYSGFYAFGSQFSTAYTNWIDSQQSSSEAISAYNIQNINSTTFPKVSNWYIPSIDELSFIMDKIKNEELNAKILASGGVPIGDSRVGATGWVWSSTGTFDETIPTEYIQTQSISAANSDSAAAYPVNEGTKAWAVNLEDVTGTNIKVKKANRLDQYEVRPVRMVRCDGRYYSSADNPARYWRFWGIPSMSINNIINGP